MDKRDELLTRLAHALALHHTGLDMMMPFGQVYARDAQLLTDTYLHLATTDSPLAFDDLTTRLLAETEEVTA